MIGLAIALVNAAYYLAIERLAGIRTIVSPVSVMVAFGVSFSAAQPALHLYHFDGGSVAIYLEMIRQHAQRTKNGG